MGNKEVVVTHMHDLSYCIEFINPMVTETRGCSSKYISKVVKVVSEESLCKIVDDLKSLLDNTDLHCTEYYIGNDARLRNYSQVALELFYVSAIENNKYEELTDSDVETLKNLFTTILRDEKTAGAAMFYCFYKNPKFMCRMLRGIISELEKSR